MSGPRLTLLVLSCFGAARSHGALGRGRSRRSARQPRPTVRGAARRRSARLISQFAPPAIERGISPLTSQAPDSPDVIRRRSIRATSGVIDRIGASRRAVRRRHGHREVPRRRRRSATRVRSMRVAVRAPARCAPGPTTRTSTSSRSIPARTPRRSRGRSRRGPTSSTRRRPIACTPQFVPNDQFYSLQWNLPLIDMERAWDIQPAAGSSITVAVLDTGVAFTDATMKFHANAFASTRTATSCPRPRPERLSGARRSDAAVRRRRPSSARHAASSRRTISSGTTTCRSIFDGHGTHVSGTIGQLTNNGRAAASANGGGTPASRSTSS